MNQIGLKRSLALIALWAQALHGCDLEHVMVRRLDASGIQINGTNCKQREQSPINLPRLPNVVRTLDPDQRISPLKLEAEQGSIEFENLGSTVEVIPALDEEEPLQVRILGSNLANQVGRSDDQDISYKLAQFHFHWDVNLNSGKGSEHLRGGQSFPAEAHFVFYNEKYGDIDSALQNADGLLVVGNFIRRGRENDEAQRLIDSVEGTSFLEGDHVNVDNFSVQNMLNGISLARYDTYRGSLTTGDCEQVVTWVVLHDVLQFSRSQLEFFNRLEKEKGQLIAPNFRETQYRNGRTVYRSVNPCRESDLNCRLRELLRSKDF